MAEQQPRDYDTGAKRCNILERTHYYVTNTCSRSEDTFDGGANNPGEGAFVVNISGPVRAHPLVHRREQLQVHGEHRFFYPNRKKTRSPNCEGMPDFPAMAVRTIL